VQRTVDLDKEIKASGYFDGEETELLEKVG